MKNKSSVFLLFLSLAGFFDSSYLTILHYKNIIPPCSITYGCEKVLTSQFATILDVPISIFGSFFFLTLIFLLLLGWIKYFKLLILAGVLVAVVLLYIQAFVLRAYCQYCLLVEAIIFAMFILSFSLVSPAGLDKNKKD
ncbi:MAG: Vitamin epoxide reductase [Candidatus Levybacteria bacterium]|nr:Vitamin epoxide reductase [Candidatus Levybacteria bacterium]